MAAIKRKKAFRQTMGAEGRDASTMTTTSTSTTTTTTIQEMQTENKTTNENVSKTPSGETNVNEKKGKGTENIKHKTTSKCRKRSKKYARKRRQQESKNNKKGYNFGWYYNKISEGLGTAKIVRIDCKVYVTHFSGATTGYIKGYFKIPSKNPPDHFILHVGANDLISNQTSVEIAISIINLESSMKGEFSTSVYHQL